MKTLYPGLQGPPLLHAIMRDQGRVISEFGFKGTMECPRIMAREMWKRQPAVVKYAVVHLHDEHGTCHKCEGGVCQAVQS